MAMDLRVNVFGPAYLDRVLKVDGPLVDPEQGPPIDQSVDGELGIGEGPGLLLVDSSGGSIVIELPGDWPGPFGRVELRGNLWRLESSSGARYAACPGTTTWEAWARATRRLCEERSGARSGPTTTRPAGRLSIC